MPWQSRSLWIAALAVAYAAFAGLRATGGEPLAWASLLLPLACAYAWKATTLDFRREDRIDPQALSATRLTAAGAALFLASTAGTTAAGFVAGENLGAALAALGSLWALARIAPLGGIAEPHPAARRLDAAAFATLFWVVAITLPAARAIFPERTEGLHPLAIEYATVVASIASLAVQLFASARLAALRRAEIGVAERAQASLWLGSISFAIAVLASSVNVLKPEQVLPLSVVVASLGSAISASSREPENVLRFLRLLLATTLLTTPIALFALYVSRIRPAFAALVSFGATGAGAIAALIADRVASRMGPGNDRLKVALAAATRAAMTPDPEEALRAALFELRSVLGPGGEAPALYRFFPSEHLSVDRAGFLHIEKAEMPTRLVAMADEEPERILRIEVLHAVSVRKPEVRPLIAWMEENHIAAVSVVPDADGPMGALVVPSSAQRRPSTLAEVRALRALSDRLGAVLGVSSMLSRSRQRELVSRGDFEKTHEDRQNLRSELTRIEGQFQAIAESLAKRARVAIYSPAAQAAVQRLETLAKEQRVITLLSAPGVDAVAWAALVHLASPQQKGVMVVVDATSPLEHEVSRWHDELKSPLKAASGGTLVLLDAQSLPPLVQNRIASAHLEELLLVVTLPGTVDSLAGGGALSEPLADRLGDRSVALPTLANRGEDISLLVLEALTRIGLRLRQTPFGIEPHALSALVEYEFPGNDAELEGILLRAALAAPQGARAITLQDLETSGFALPPGSTRRPRGSGPTIPNQRRRKTNKSR